MFNISKVLENIILREVSQKGERQTHNNLSDMLDITKHSRGQTSALKLQKWKTGLQHEADRIGAD